MIEFKSLQNRFLIHQALLAAASANAAFKTNSLQHDSLEINTSNSSLSSKSPSPIPVSSPNKHKLSDTDELHGLYPSKKNKQPCKQPASSFLISDILGLNTNNKPEIPISDEMRQYQQYQATLQQTYFQALASSEFMRLIASNTKMNELLSSHYKPQPQVSPIPRVESSSDCESNKTKYATGILSSLEQMTKSQFDDDDGFKISSCLNKNEPSAKRQCQQPHVNSGCFVKRSRDTEETNKMNNADTSANLENTNKADDKTNLFPAWVYCTRYSDRPSAGPRHRKKSSKSSKTNVNFNANHSVSVNSSKKEEISSKLVKTNNSVKNNSYSSSSSNSSFSHSPQFYHKQKIKPSKPVEYDHYSTENVSRILYDKHESNNEFNDNEEELCYDSDDSNMSNSKRPRTAFTTSQLNRLKSEFEKCKYLTGEKRQYLANELKLNESQIKIWFQNKRAKIKKSSGVKNSLAVQLMEQGLYNHGSNVKDEC